MLNGVIIPEDRLVASVQGNRRTVTDPAHLENSGAEFTLSSIPVTNLTSGFACKRSSLH